MKKLFISILAICLVIMPVSAQNVPREFVLFEAFTGVNCVFCPGAANGIADLMSNGCQVAPLAYHSGNFATSEYMTSETIARNAYYASWIAGYPTVIADGVYHHSGGGMASSSMYSTYLPFYTAQISTTSPFSINLDFERISSTQFRATADVNQVGECNAADLRIFIVLSQCNIAQNWQGMTSLHHVVRDMIPDQNGTAYAGGAQTVSELFDLGAFPQEDCWLTAFVQDYSTKEVFQAVRITMNRPDNELALALLDINHLEKTNCSGTLNPLITVKNQGSTSVSSFDMVATLNGTEIHRQTWAGDPLDFSESIEVEFSSFSFATADEMNFEFLVENPNGESILMTSNEILVTIPSAPICSDYVKFTFRTDDNPSESSAKLFNMSTGECVQEMTYPIANTVFTEYLFIEDPAVCYRLVIYDAGGNGITSYFTITTSDGTMILDGHPDVNPFTDQISLEVAGTSADIPEIAHDFKLYPNPANDMIAIQGEGIESIDIYNVLGQLMDSFKITSDDTQNINTSSYKSGVYVFRITTKGSKFVSKRVVIAH